MLQIQMCLKTSLVWLACWSPYMSQQHCVVNDLYTLTLRRCSTWRWFLHPWGVIPSLHILLSSSFVYQGFCRSIASRAVLWSFPGPKKYVIPVLRESWRCRWGIMLLPWIHSASVQQVLVIVFLLDLQNMSSHLPHKSTRHLTIPLMRPVLDPHNWRIYET